jgi:hypothetical protein
MAAVLSVVLTPATALAGTPRPRVALAADALTVRVGAPIQLLGTVTPNAHTSVSLQRFVAGHWVGLSHQTTSATGSYAFAVKAPAKPTTWVFRVVRGATASHTLHIKVSRLGFKVQAKAIATNVTVGRPLVVTGKVTPKATGAVRLQILRGKVWATLSSAKLTAHSTFTLSARRPAGAYKLRVVKPYTATIATGVSATQVVAVIDPGTPTPPITPAQPALSYASPDDALLAEGAARLVFSAVRGQPLPPARAFTLTNNGDAAATVSGLAVTGADAASYGLASGQPTSLTVPAHGSATVSIAFHPTAPTGCPTASDPYGVSGSNRDAALTFATSDPALPSGSVALSGLISCDFGGANEPVLHQIVQALGYSTVVDTPSSDQRFLTLQGIYPGTDEVTAHYFRAADASQPVSLTDLAHYSSASTVPYHATGWFAKGASLPTDGSCNASCHTLWSFAADPSSTTYNQNQKLMPTVVGGTTFTPGTVFGLQAGDNKDVVFSDDALNAPAPAPHDMRVYPAYGPGRALIPNTYLVAVDTGRASESKNSDFQDLVMVLRNVVPAG